MLYVNTSTLKHEKVALLSSITSPGAVEFIAITIFVVKAWTWSRSSLRLSGGWLIISNDSPKSCQRKSTSWSSPTMTNKLPLCSSCKCPRLAISLKSQWYPTNKMSRSTSERDGKRSSTLPTSFMTFTPMIISSCISPTAMWNWFKTGMAVFSGTQSLHVAAGVAGGKTNGLNWNSSRHLASPSYSDSRINRRYSKPFSLAAWNNGRTILIMLLIRGISWAACESISPTRIMYWSCLPMSAAASSKQRHPNSFPYSRGSVAQGYHVRTTPANRWALAHSFKRLHCITALHVKSFTWCFAQVQTELKEQANTYATNRSSRPHCTCHCDSRAVDSQNAIQNAIEGHCEDLAKNIWPYPNGSQNAPQLQQIVVLCPKKKTLERVLPSACHLMQLWTSQNGFFCLGDWGSKMTANPPFMK